MQQGQDQPIEDSHIRQLRGAIEEYLTGGYRGSLHGHVLEGGWIMGQEVGCFVGSDKTGVRVMAKDMANPTSGRGRLLYEHIENDTRMVSLLHRLGPSVKNLIASSSALARIVVNEVTSRMGTDFPPDRPTVDRPDKQDYSFADGLVRVLYWAISGKYIPDMSIQTEGDRQALKAGAYTLVVSDNPRVLDRAKSCVNQIAGNEDAARAAELVRVCRSIHAEVDEELHAELRELDLSLEAGRIRGQCHICRPSA